MKSEDIKTLEDLYADFRIMAPSLSEQDIRMAELFMKRAYELGRADIWNTKK